PRSGPSGRRSPPAPPLPAYCRRCREDRRAIGRPSRKTGGSRPPAEVAPAPTGPHHPTAGSPRDASRHLPAESSWLRLVEEQCHLLHLLLMRGGPVVVDGQRAGCGVTGLLRRTAPAQ